MNSKSWSHHQVPLTVLKHKLYPPPFGAGVWLITSPFDGDKEATDKWFAKALEVEANALAKA